MRIGQSWPACFTRVPNKLNAIFVRRYCTTRVGADGKRRIQVEWRAVSAYIFSMSEGANDLDAESSPATTTERVAPPTPGFVIRNQVLGALNTRQASLARAMSVSSPRLNQVMMGIRPLTAEMALRLAKVTGTEPEYWLHLQQQHDLFEASKRFSADLNALPQLKRISSELFEK